MKKLFTLLSMAGVIFSLHAQTVVGRPVSKNGESPKLIPVAHPYHKTIGYSSPLRESAANSIFLDYFNIDGNYAYNNGGQNYYDPGAQVNAYLPNSYAGTFTFGAVIFDTLVSLDASGNEKIYPVASSTVHLDSLDIAFIDSSYSNATDTIKVTVFSQSSLAFPGSGSAGKMTNNDLWDTLIITNTTIPFNLDFTGSGTNDFTDMTLYPNLAFAQGTEFGVRVDFYGDTADHFYLGTGETDLCNMTCGSAPSAAGFNSLFYINDIQNGTNYSGICNGFGTPFFFDCPQTGVYEPGACELIQNQDWFIWPSITVTDSFAVNIIADSLISCNAPVPSQINMAANIVGSNAAPFTYAWSVVSGDGTLSSNSDTTTTFSAGLLNTVISVTVTDANNATASASVTVVSKAIAAGIANNLPVTVPCTIPQGSHGTEIVTRITGAGSSLAKTYLWSTGSTASDVYVSTPGTYGVTVMNTEGCQATTTIMVIYPGGITNDVSFTAPTSGLVTGSPLTFVNTSSGIDNWSGTWAMGDQDTVYTDNGASATHTYTTVGTFVVTLTMDSGGCSFTSPPQHISIISGINDVSFDNAISLQPNPSNGNVLLSFNGAEKNVSITVYDILGKQVESFEVGNVPNTFSKTLDFTTFAGGTYLIKVQSGNQTAIKKLVITR